MEAVSGRVCRLPADGKSFFAGGCAGRRQDLGGDSIRCVRTGVGSRGSGGVSARVSRGFGFPRVGISFCDDGSLRYYGSGGRSGVGIVRAEKAKGCGTERKKKGKEGKKMTKIVRGLAEDIRAFSAMGFGMEDSPVGDDRAKIISDAAQTLLAQLESLQAEKMEMKRKHKEERDTRVKTMDEMCDEDSSSSSSSESSDSDAECEVISMKDLQKTAAMVHQEHLLPYLGEGQMVADDPTKGKEARGAATITNPADVGAPAAAAAAMKVEVCMGGKCKKSGAVDLVQGFERALGADGAVSACKCLGKCREGPNVRVVSATGSNREGVVVEPPSPPPICVSVGLEDIQVIVSNYFGKSAPGLLAA